MPLTADNGLQTFHISWILFPLVCYLFGSIPFGKLISQWAAGIDITQRGSGNIGAANVAREIGIKWGLFTLVLDAFKGFVPVFLFGLLFPQIEVGHAVVGLSTLIGHQFSLYRRFRGGKGVATALGIYLAISPISSLIALFVFVLTVYIWDFVSLGSIVSASIMPFVLTFLGKTDTLLITSLLVAGLICLKHKDNIHRLVRGRERKWRRRIVREEDQEDDPIPHRNRNR